MQRLRRKQPSGLAVLLPAAIAAAAAFGVQAQSATPPSSSTQVLGRTPAQQAQQELAYRAVRLSELKGQEVRSPQGRKLGELEDVVLDTGSGRIRYAVMSFDPGIFSGERLFLLPMNQLRMGDRDAFIMDLRRENLENAAVNRSQWNASWLEDPANSSRIDQAWRAGGASQTGSSGQLVRASDLVGQDVRGRQGERIGELEEIVLNVPRDQVHYAVVSFDPGWLQAEKRVLLPMRALHRAPGGDHLLANIDRGQAQSLRGFDQRQYASLNDRQFVADVDRYLLAIPATVVTWQTSSAGSGLQAPGGSPAGLAGNDADAGPDTRALGAGSAQQLTGSAQPDPAGMRPQRVDRN